MFLYRTILKDVNSHIVFQGHQRSRSKVIFKSWTRQAHRQTDYMIRNHYMLSEKKKIKCPHRESNPDRQLSKRRHRPLHYRDYTSIECIQPYRHFTLGARVVVEGIEWLTLGFCSQGHANLKVIMQNLRSYMSFCIFIMFLIQTMTLSITINTI